MDIQRRENESKFEYHKRLVFGKLVDGTLSDEDYTELSEYVYGKKYSSDVARRMMYGSRDTLQLLEHEQVETISDDKVLKEYDIKKRDLYIERQKLREEKNEYNAWLREQARLELFFERIDESTDRLLQKKPRNLPKPIIVSGDSDVIVSAFADPHYGCEFIINGFNGEVINQYNAEIFEKRMIEYRDELIDFGSKNNIKHLYLIDLGDSIEGILHLSGIKALRGNIVDHILDYADFIEEWLESLSHYFYIEFYTSEGNHSDLRLLTGKKNDFPHENLEKIYTRNIKKFAKKNKNINVNDSLDGLNYFNVNGYNILTAHGNNESNIKNSIKEYEDTYGIDIDYFLVGHLHSKNEIEIAKGKEVIQVRSIMGINIYSKDIKKTSEAGATMFTVRKNYGRKYVNEVKLK